MRLSDVLNLAEKTYTPKGNGVQGKILTVGPAIEKNGWWNQAITLQGIDNTKAPIEHSSKYPDGMLNQSHIGQDSTWRLKWWRNTNQGGKQMLTGYPEVKIEGDGSITAQASPAVPYNQPQAPAQPLQATNPPQGMQMPTTYAYPVTPETQARMARSVGVEAASRVVTAMIRTAATLKTAKEKDFDWNGKLLEISDMLSMYINSGMAKAAEPQPQDTPEQGVCPSCQLLRVDCTCPTEPFVR